MAITTNEPDARGGPRAASVQDVAGLFNPRTRHTETQRTPTKFHTFNNVAIGQPLTTLYQARNGVRYRVLGGVLTTSVVATAAVMFNLLSGAGETIVTWSPPAANTAFPFELPGNGYLSSVLADLIQVNGPVAVLSGTLFLCEERDE